MPAEVAVYALMDAKALWNLAVPFAPPGTSTQGRPTLPVAEWQPVLDFVWNNVDGPVSLGFVVTPAPRMIVCAPLKSGAPVKSSFNQIVTLLRMQKLVESTIAQANAQADMTVLKLAKGAPMPELVFAFTSQVMLITDSLDTATKALAAGSARNGLARNAEFTAARTKANVSAGQLFWLFGSGAAAGLPAGLNVSVRREGGGLSFSGFVPLPR